MIPKIEQQSPQAIKQFQNQLLCRQLKYVVKNSPYYQRIFKTNTIDINTIKTIDDLIQLPVTTKSELQKYNNDFFCVPQQKIIDYASTSGTTGKPVNFGMTDKDLDRLAYNECISFQCAGITSNDTVQLMTTMDRRFMAGLAYFLGLRKLGASVIRTGSGIPALQWESILRNTPSYLIAVPSFLLKLIHYAENNGIDINTTSVKAAYCIGEPLRNQDLKPGKLAQRIQEKWGIQLFSTYASTEMSTAFTECTQFQGGHQHPELIITEILNENNHPVEEGEIGELTITPLGIEALPLIRFKTGDLVRKYEKPCDCGRNTPRIGPVLGRAQQMIKFKGTTLFPPAIQEVLNHFDTISGHVLILQKDENENDKIIVKIVSTDQSEGFIQQLKEAFQANIRVVPILEFISQTAFNQLAHSSSHRKPRWVIDERK